MNLNEYSNLTCAELCRDDIVYYESYSLELDSQRASSVGVGKIVGISGDDRQRGYYIIDIYSGENYYVATNSSDYNNDCIFKIGTLEEYENINERVFGFWD